MGRLLQGQGTRPRSRLEARASQEHRLLLAMAQLVGARGYGAASVAMVLARARVSRKTFYVYFRDKEHCFLTAYEALTGILIGELEMAPGSRAGRSASQLERYLGALNADLLVARAFIIEVLSAGPRALVARELVNARFADLVFADVSSDPVVRRAIIGGVNEVVTSALLAGERDLTRLRPGLQRFVEAASR